MMKFFVKSKKSISFLAIMMSMALIATAYAGICLVLPQTQVHAAPPAGYTLAFTEDFNGASLDTQTWGYRTNADCFPANVSVSNGSLKLDLSRNTSSSSGFAGGGVITKDTFVYGYYETRAKLYNGHGFHSAFWTAAWDGQYPMPTGYSTIPRIEIDCFENEGPTNYTLGVIRWYPTPITDFGRTTVTTTDLTTDYHVWGFEFTPTELKYYLDGVLKKTINVSALPHNDQHVWLTVIPYYPAQIDSSKPNGYVYGSIYFDYFKFYTKDGGNPTPSPTPTPNPNDVIVDNTDSGFTTDSAWTTSTFTAGYYGTNYAHDGNSAAEPTKWAKWTPNITTAGNYGIYMRWAGTSGRPDAAPLTIEYNGGTDTSKTVNQTINDAQWNYIGTYNLSSGTGNYVKILASDAGYTIADAVKFVYVGGSTPSPTPTPTPTPIITPGPTPTPAPLLTDDFEDGNSTGWSVVNGSWAVVGESDNQVYKQSYTTGEGLVYAGNTGWTNYSVEANVKVYNSIASSGSGLVARYSNSNNFYLLRLHSGLGKVQLLKKVNGTFTTIADYAFTVNTNQRYNLLLRLNGTSITGYVDGVQVIATTDSSLASGCIGLRTFDQSTSIDDVYVY